LTAATLTLNLPRDWSEARNGGFIAARSRRTRSTLTGCDPLWLCYAPHMDDKPEPVPFTVDVTVDRTRVQVTLLLRPGTAVTVAETKTTTESEQKPPEPDILR
jgi:hypothetical protein